MALYEYRIFDPLTGQITKRRDEFRDDQELISAVRADRKLLLSYKPVRFALARILEKKVSRPEMAEFCRNLSFLISAGVPILQSLEDLAEMSENKTLKRAIRRVIKDIRDGQTLSESLENLRRIFPPVVRNLASIGEATGKLDITMSEASNHIARVHEIITQTNRAMIYPAFVISSIGFALVVWFFYVLPKIFAVFKDMNVKLPLATRMLMEFVNLLKQFWFIIPSFAALIILWWLVARAYEPLGYRTEKFILKIPIFGVAKRISIMAFFFEYFSLILGAGIDIMTGLNLMKESIESRIVRRLLTPISDDIRSGLLFSEACERTNFFRPLEVRIVRIGEESGKLVEQMKILGDFYYKKLTEFVEALPKIIEPLLIIIVGGVFLIIIIALLGPVYELISAIGKAR